MTPDVALPVVNQVARDRSARRTDRVAALRALGRIATEAAQASLLDRVTDADPRVQQAAFEALGHFADPSVLSALEHVNAIDADGRRQLTLTRAYRLRCGRAEWTLFVNRGLETLASWELLLGRPWIAALAARWLPEGKSVAMQYLVLSRPVGRAVRIEVPRGTAK